MTHSGLEAAVPVTAHNEHGEPVTRYIAAERPLTLYLDRREIVTLMTLGTQPELLVLGYLRNQGLVQALEDITAIQVDWEVEAAAVTTHQGQSPEIEEKLSRRTVTTGCGQGTVFGHLQEQLSQIQLTPPRCPNRPCMNC